MTWPSTPVDKPRRSMRRRCRRRKRLRRRKRRRRILSTKTVTEKFKKMTVSE